MSVVLLFVAVFVIVIDLVSIILGFGPPFGLLIASMTFLLLALGIALFCVASLGAHPMSNPVGGLLFAYARGVALIGVGRI